MSARLTKATALGAVLTLGVVMIWACELKLLQLLHHEACAGAPSLPPSPLPPSLPPFLPTANGCALPHEDCHPTWHKPFFVGLALKSIWVLGLPIVLLWRHLCAHGPRASNSPAAAADTQRETSIARSLPLTKRTVLACAALTLFVQGASITWITSIPLTSASANSAIYQMSCPLAYLFSLPLLRDERLSLSKSLGVLLALGGVGAVIAAKRCGPDAVPNAVSGDLLVLASAALYALKEVLYKRWLGGSSASPTNTSGCADPSHGSSTTGGSRASGRLDSAATVEIEGKPVHQIEPVPASAPTADATASHVPDSASVSAPTPIMDAALTVSLIGVWCVLSAPIWLACLNASGVEPFELPPWDLACGYALVGGMMAAYQVLLFAAIALTSPTFVAVGQLLVSPISIAWDAIELHYAMPPVALLGTAAIIAALCLVIGAPTVDAVALQWWRACRSRAVRADGNARLVDHARTESEALRHVQSSQ